MSTRNRTAPLLILCIFLVAIIGFLMYKYALAVRTVTNLKLEYNELLSRYSALKANYTQLKMLYNDLRTNYTALERKYNELKSKYYDVSAKLRRIQLTIDKVKAYAEYAKRVEKETYNLIPLVVPPQGEYTFYMSFTRNGVLAPGEFDVFSIGELHKGDVVYAKVRPENLVLALFNSTLRVVAYGVGSINVVINSSQDYYIAVYCPKTFTGLAYYSLLVSAKHVYTPESLFNDTSLEARVIFNILEAYNYWYYFIRPKLESIAKFNVTELEYLYATSLTLILKKLGLNVRYAVIGDFPVITGSRINLEPESVVPAVLVMYVNGTKMSSLLNRGLDVVGEFLKPYQFLWKYNTTTFIIYIDTYSVARMDFGSTEGFIPFTILYVGR